MNIAGTSQDAPTGPTDRIVDLNAAIDVLVEQSRVKKSENELPKIDHMKEVLEGLQFHHFRRIIAAEFSKESKSPRIPQNLWLGKLHKVIFGILHTKHLPAEHTDMCFSIAHGAFQLVGSAWFTEDLRLLPLFAALLTVQLRLLLHTPSEVNEEKLVCCVELMEGLIDLVENHDDVDDLVATHIGAHLHEAIEFSIEFLSVSSDDLPLNAKATLFRIVCCYLSVGGHSLFPKEKLISVKRSLKQILESGDIPTLREMFEPLESALPEA